MNVKSPSIRVPGAYHGPGRRLTLRKYLRQFNGISNFLLFYLLRSSPNWSSDVFPLVQLGRQTRVSVGRYRDRKRQEVGVNCQINGVMPRTFPLANWNHSGFKRILKGRPEYSSWCTYHSWKGRLLTLKEKLWKP